MKTTILAGAVVAVLYGTASSAACPDKASTQASVSTPERSLDATAQAGDVKADATVGTEEHPYFDDGQAGIGGSGDVQQDATSSDSRSACAPSGINTGMGGSGTYTAPESQPVTSEPMPSSSTTSSSAAVTSGSSYDPGAFDTHAKKEKKKESDAKMRGLTVEAGAGVEGYSFGLAPEIAPGPAWGVTAAIRPSKVLGLELGYSGATNELRGPAGTGGADIVRNGGQAVATVGLTAAPVQPYLLGGIGVSHYNVRAGSAGFHDDTTGAIPVGAGLRTHVGRFTADARLGYNFLFSQDFATGVPDSGVGAPGSSNFSDAGRYTGTLALGTTF